jgi:two-component system, cell cycle response regulator CpdR
MARSKDTLITQNPPITPEDTAPVAPEDAAPVAPEDTAPATSSVSAPLRILYVEDNDIVREITSELLAQDQRQIVACATAEEALTEFSAAPFDLVITDVSLPVMSGIELARRILMLKPHVPIILASGYDLDFAVDGWAANVRSIIKPFESSDIEALMSKLLEL